MLASLGEHDPERPARDLRVLEEELVEIAHPVEEEQSGLAALISTYCAIIGVTRLSSAAFGCGVAEGWYAAWLDMRATLAKRIRRFIRGTGSGPACGQAFPSGRPNIAPEAQTLRATVRKLAAHPETPKKIR